MVRLSGVCCEPERNLRSAFEIKFNPDGKPVQITCPNQQTVSVHTTHQQKGFVACFEPSICQNCPFFHKERCPAQLGKRDGYLHLRFTQTDAQASERRRRSQERKKEAGNLRSAVEATVRSVKHPFAEGKLPVRGMFRVTCMVIGSAAMSNVRRIQRYLEVQKQLEKARSEQDNASKTAAPSLWGFVCTLLGGLRWPNPALWPVLGC